jgi:hypothetical protein
MEPQQTNPLNSDRADWPAGVEPISFENIGRLGVGRDSQLYWDGKPVQLRRRLVLSRWQKIGTLVVGTAAVIGALGSFAQGWSAYHEWACRVGWPAVVCQSNSHKASP